MNKYGTDDIDDLLRVEIRLCYRHEQIAPGKLIVKQGQKIAVRVISQFGEESMKVIAV